MVTYGLPPVVSDAPSAWGLAASESLTPLPSLQVRGNCCIADARRTNSPLPPAKGKRRFLPILLPSKTEITSRRERSGAFEVWWHLCLRSQQGCPSLSIIIMIFTTSYVHLAVFVSWQVLRCFYSVAPYPRSREPGRMKLSFSALA